MTATSFEKYSDLDNLGRCGVAMASVGQDIMPTEERGSIGQIKPAGWHTVKLLAHLSIEPVVPNILFSQPI